MRRAVLACCLAVAAPGCERAPVGRMGWVAAPIGPATRRPVPALVAATPGEVSSIAVAGSRLIATTWPPDAGVWEAALAGGAVRSIHDGPACCATAAGGDLYFAADAVYGVAAGGEAPARIAGTDGAGAFAVDDSGVYFAAHPTCSPDYCPWALYRVPRAGGAPVLLAYPLGALAPQHLELDATTVLLGDVESLRALAKGDGAPRTLVARQGGAVTLAGDDGLAGFTLDGARACFASRGGAVDCLGTDGAHLARLADGVESPRALVAADGHIYVLGAGATDGAGRLARVAAAGGGEEVLADHLSAPVALAVAQGRVYFSAGRRIFALPRD